MKKRFLSILLVLSMLVICMPVIASADTSGTCGDNVTWTLDDNGTLTISGTGAINNSAFSSNDNFTDVIIEEGVTSLGDSAFYYCYNLKRVTLPDSLTSIGRGAFYDCWGLEDITIPKSVISIENAAFYDCRSIPSLTLPDGLTTIEHSVFTGCTSLTSITIPKTVKTISTDAFRWCGLTSLTIPEGVTSIESMAFWGCRNLQSIVIPKSIKNIGLGAFYECEVLTDIYYTGTEADWNAISIDSSNKEDLLNVTIHYNYSSIVSPDTYTLSDIEKTDSGITFTVQTNENAVGEQTVIVSCYDEDGVFMGLQQQQIKTSMEEPQTISVDIEYKNTNTVKAFIWNSIDYMLPASHAVSLDI